MRPSPARPDGWRHRHRHGAIRRDACLGRCWSCQRQGRKRMGELNRLIPALAAAGWLCAATSVGAADRSQARSMIISQNGVVAAEHPLASQAGAAILASGGNSIDAAIATNAMMG